MIMLDMDYIYDERKADCVLRALMMTLGFTFEINRLDRNNFIEVYENNIIQELRPAFNMIQYIDEHEHTLGLPYDILSLMHFKWN